MSEQEQYAIPAIHGMIIKLAIAYTLVGAFVFTVVVTCLSLVGWIQFADSGQQQKLFYIVIAEVAAIGVGYFSGLLKFDPAQVQREVVLSSILNGPAGVRSVSALDSDDHKTDDRIRYLKRTAEQLKVNGEPELASKLEFVLQKTWPKADEDSKKARDEFMTAVKRRVAGAKRSVPR
jgi:hypothetical protein